MIRDLENKEVNPEGFLGMDGTTADMALFLLTKIAEAKSKNLYGDSLVSNYNTYDFSFKDNLMIVSGLMKEDAVFRFKLSEFIEELKRLVDPHTIKKNPEKDVL